MKPLPPPLSGPRPSRLRRTALLGLGLAAVPGPVMVPGQTLPSGWSPQDTTSPQVQAAAAFAAQSLSAELARQFVVEDIRSAESQTVDGTDYRIALRLAQLQDDLLGTRDDCTVEVDEPLAAQAPEQLTSFDCQVVGGSSTATVHV